MCWLGSSAMFWLAKGLNLLSYDPCASNSGTKLGRIGAYLLLPSLSVPGEREGNDLAAPAGAEIPGQLAPCSQKELTNRINYLLLETGIGSGNWNLFTTVVVKGGAGWQL
jgi:hypothetical protein